MRQQLTPRQQQLLEYFQRRIAALGAPPSLRQAAADLGVSHTAIAQSLRLLEEKGYIRREGRYSRTLHLLNPAMQTSATQRWREVPVIGQIAAGLPMYAQEEWDGSIVVDTALFRSSALFALKIKGDSMTGAGMLNGDLAICEPRQFAHNGEIVVALLHGEEATVKRFFLRDAAVELRPENPDYPVKQYGFDEILIQGKVVGIQRGPGGIGHKV
jgi:repressor LexA